MDVGFWVFVTDNLKVVVKFALWQRLPVAAPTPPPATLQNTYKLRRAVGELMEHGIEVGCRVRQRSSFSQSCFAHAYLSSSQTSCMAPARGQSAVPSWLQSVRRSSTTQSSRDSTKLLWPCTGNGGLCQHRYATHRLMHLILADTFVREAVNCFIRHGLLGICVKLRTGAILCERTEMRS
jgi:hypothetical protein